MDYGTSGALNKAVGKMSAFVGHNDAGVVGSGLAESCATNKFGVKVRVTRLWDSSCVRTERLKSCDDTGGGGGLHTVQPTNSSV